ncbi:hypothetical protein ACRAWF_18795 [Streptomyces sp. L7]
MDDDAEQQHLTAAPGYALGQLAKAFTTALTHEDADTRRRAEGRARAGVPCSRGWRPGGSTIGSAHPRWPGYRPGSPRGGARRLRHGRPERGRPAPAVRDQPRGAVRCARGPAGAVRALSPPTPD